MDLVDRLRDWINAQHQEMIDLLIELVGIPTENPPGTNDWKPAVALLRSTLDRLGLNSSVIDLPTGAPVVSGSLGDGERPLYFHGHYDVVPAQRLDQFTAKRVDGRIIGRGTADMKGGLVCLIYAAAALKHLGVPLDGQIVFHLVPDEETGSTAGSGYLHANDLIDAGAVAMLTAEPTGHTVWHANKGALTMRVTIEGRESHVGLATAGESELASEPFGTAESPSVRGNGVRRHRACEVVARAPSSIWSRSPGRCTSWPIGSPRAAR